MVWLLPRSATAARNRAITRIIYDDRCTRCRQLLSYLRAYPLRRTRDDGDLAFQFAYHSTPVSGVIVG
jgi:hypothetical protein